MKKNTYILYFIFTLWCFATPIVAEHGPHIAVIYEGSNPSHTNLLTRLQTIYPRIHWHLLDLANASKQQNQIQHTSQLIITLGKMALTSALKQDEKTTVLATLIANVEFEQVLKRQKLSQRAISVIFSDPNPNLQVALAKTLFGSHKKYAVIIHQNEQGLKEAFQQSAKTLNVELEFHNFFDGQEVTKIIGTIPQRQPLIAIPDQRIYTPENFRRIILASYRREISIIGYTAGMVKAGTMATVNHRVEDHVEEIKQYLMSHLLGYHQTIRQYVSNYRIEMNHTLAQSLNLPIVNQENVESTLLANTLKENGGSGKVVTQR